VTKPCFISYAQGRHHAWDEHGRLIAWRTDLNELACLLGRWGYEVLSPNSRFAQGVRDRLRTRYPSLAAEAARR
jgi:hypothetical protein